MGRTVRADVVAGDGIDDGAGAAISHELNPVQLITVVEVCLEADRHLCGSTKKRLDIFDIISQSSISVIGPFDDVEQQNVALLMWKCLPRKAGFAQTLNSFLIDKIETGGDVQFTVPTYSQEAISHLVL